MGLFDFLKKKTTDVADHPVVNNAQDAIGGVVDNASSAVSDTASSVGSSVGSAVDSGYRRINPAAHSDIYSFHKL